MNEDDTIVVNVVNRKGGVYKSTIATHLACWLAIQGYSVAVVDADSQGHISSLLGYDPADGLYNVLAENESVPANMRIVPTEMYSLEDKPSLGMLYLLPGYKKTYKIPPSSNPFSVSDMFKAMSAEVERVQKGRQLDYIVVDSQPSMNNLDMAMFLASDSFIIPTAMESLSFDGMRDLIEEIRGFVNSRATHLGRETFIAGIIPTVYREKTAVHKSNLGFLEESYGTYQDNGWVLPPVKQRTIWAQAATVREPMFRFAPSSIALTEMCEIFEIVEMRLLQWQKTIS